MLLSLNNLSDWLSRKGYHVKSDFELTSASLSGVRLLSHLDIDNKNDNVAYIGKSEDFIHSVLPGTVICCKNDILYINSTDSEAIFNECIKAFDFFNHWELELLEAIIEDKPLDYFIELGHEVFKSPMFISGINDQTYAITAQYPADIHPVWRHRLEQGNLAFDYVAENYEGEYFKKTFSSHYPVLTYSPIWKGNVMYANLRNHQERFAAIMIYEYKHPFHPGDIQLLHVYAKIIEKNLLLHPQQIIPMSELENLSLQLLTDAVIDWKHAEKIIHSYRWDPHHAYKVLCIKSPSDIDSIMFARLRDIIRTKFNGICTIIYKEALVLIVNLSLRKGLHDLIHSLQNISSSTLVIGSSLTFLDFTRLKYYYLQASHAVREAQIQQETYLSFEQIYLKEFKNNINQNPHLCSMVHSSVIQLKAYDAKHNADYCKTLYAYLLSGCNYREAARMLYVHRNTLLYRIDKIKELLNLEFDSPHYKQILLISLLLEGISLN